MKEDDGTIQAVAALLREQGALPLSRVMECALYDPAQGYYAAGRARIGRGGDFYTNVSVGETFGSLLAQSLVQWWERLDRPLPFTYVEQGAHDGQLALDVGEGLSRCCPELAEGLEMVVIEPFAVNQARQREKLGERFSVHWVSQPEEVEPCEGVLIAHELVDAFAVHQCVRGARGWSERWARWVGEGIEIFEGELSHPDLGGELERFFGGFPPDSVVELSLQARDWLRSARQVLRRGALLVMDYGAPTSGWRRWAQQGGTLRSYRGHQLRREFWEDLGQRDITAEVAFTALAQWALEAGWEIEDFVDQSHFLLALARERLLALEGVSPRPPSEEKFLRQLQTLTHPEALGRKIQVLQLSVGLEGSGVESLRQRARSALEL